MWQKFKLWFAGIKPDLFRFLKAAIKLGIDILLPTAIEAVTQAEIRGGTGKEKFEFATGYVKTQAPKAAIGAIATAVQGAWATKEVEEWK